MLLKRSVRNKKERVHRALCFFKIYSCVLLQVYALMKMFTVFVPSVPDGNPGFSR